MIENTKQAKVLVKTDVSRRTDFLDENFMKTKFKGTKGSWEKINTLGNTQDKDCFYKTIRNEKTIYFMFRSYGYIIIIF